MTQLGDVTRIDGGAIEPVDVVTFGSPCQGLSIAGKQLGLADARSGLFMEAVRIIKEMREKTHGMYPTFAIWENVPGAFSSQKGEDFRVVLEELAKIKASDAAVPRPPKGKWADAGAIMGDGWSLAYRVLDAQFHGVPQRRRRILLVTDFAGGRAPKILFECAGLPGYSAESGAAGQGAAGDAENSTGPNDRAVGVMCLPFDTTQITSPRNGSNPQSGDPCHPVAAQGHPPAVCLDCRNLAGNTELSATVQAKGDGGFSLNYINPVVAYDARGNGDGAIVPTITGDHEGSITDYAAVAVQKAYTMQSFGQYADQNIASSLKQRDCKDATDLIVETLRAFIRYIVRRLTPTECARLQGFPDGWGELTTIAEMSDEDCDFWCNVLKSKARIEGKPYKPKTRTQMVAWYNKLHNDSAEYKMWGNGVALPVVRVPLHEMEKLGAKTLGSLFDGSGGFPLAGILEGITPLWASEVEPYPLAVTRERFGTDAAMGQRQPGKIQAGRHDHA